MAKKVKKKSDDKKTKKKLTAAASFLLGDQSEAMEEDHKTSLVVSLIPLVERNYEKLEDAREIYSRSSRIYKCLRGNTDERPDFLRLCDTKESIDGWVKTPNRSINVILAILLPHIFSSPHATDDLLESMKAMKH